MKIIEYNKQKILPSDIKEISRAIKQKHITGGKYLQKFENAVCTKLNVKYSLSCNSGTSALYLAFKAINILKNDIVILPAINFVASCNILKLFEAKIFLSDVDPQTGQMSSNNLIDCIKKNKLKKIKAVVTMHLGGSIECPEKIFQLKKKYNFYLIEDACHALGSKYKIKNKNYYIGSCKHSDICTFSLHPIKNITSGEGGVLTTSLKKMYKKAKLFRSHGVIKNPKKHFDYQVVSSGLNFRLSEINCALAFSQFKRLSEINKKRNFLAKIYLDFFKNHSFLKFVKKNKKNYSSYHLIICLIKDEKKKLRDKLLNFLILNKIYPQINYIPVYKFYNHQSLKKNSKFFSGTEKYFKTCLSLPLHLDLKKKDVIYVCKKINMFFSKNLKN